MCGRYTLTLDMETLQANFPFAIEEIAFVPRYNIAPSQQVLTYGAESPRTAAYMRWGLIPVWAKEANIGFKMINALSETLATS